MISEAQCLEQAASLAENLGAVDVGRSWKVASSMVELLAKDAVASMKDAAKLAALSDTTALRAQQRETLRSYMVGLLQPNAGRRGDGNKHQGHSQNSVWYQVFCGACYVYYCSPAVAALCNPLLPNLAPQEAVMELTALISTDVTEAEKGTAASPSPLPSLSSLFNSAHSGVLGSFIAALLSSCAAPPVSTTMPPTYSGSSHYGGGGDPHWHGHGTNSRYGAGSVGGGADGLGWVGCEAVTMAVLEAMLQGIGALAPPPWLCPWPWPWL